ncbi:hypothetical protein CK203_032530 [Vitis vinifera]|uniref:Uncharacterized protein n=1 Tax=Vitis vinifera TaxID=29760 RepID=A0A438I6R1_VITVI|nr:hypothetical protein CK203_032530 [Vitis vinifera]
MMRRRLNEWKNERKKNNRETLVDDAPLTFWPATYKMYPLLLRLRVELRASHSTNQLVNLFLILGGAKYRKETAHQTTMADSATSSLHLSTESNQVGAEDAQFGQADCVKWILQLPSPSLLLQQPNEKGDTPLHLAAKEGNLAMVKNLIAAAKQLQEGDMERGVQQFEDLEFTYGANTEGNTPLYISAEWGFRDLVQMILDNCSSPAHSGIKGPTALHAVVILNDQVVDFISNDKEDTGSLL